MTRFIRRCLAMLNPYISKSQRVLNEYSLSESECPGLEDEQDDLSRMR
ncbi:MAG: hypothetical protein ACKO9I_12045 [Sphaerospermopsis kisseleviana]|jgi:hypothetical protein|uniref:Uncharacterized protein n=1 Tax=Sphaerospermopsis kisseleviana CS-549 TaxID=3021783 RepID=A0ABT4ZYZ2_9CYAN|nr:MULTISPECIES: hypothetical protein [Sphaerospermopsis]MDB9444484.1 hypothetical protein [Sphaerospermopsis kisseleviana CS-549]BAZ82946.1 hypothetical protein NIES73_42290 [Sphaerospermopsis kisseleviana NIES-73]